MQRAANYISYTLLGLVFLGVCFAALNISRDTLDRAIPKPQSDLTRLAKACKTAADPALCVQAYR